MFIPNFLNFFKTPIFFDFPDFVTTLKYNNIIYNVFQVNVIYKKTFIGITIFYVQDQLLNVTNKIVYRNKCKVGFHKLEQVAIITWASTKI